MEKTIEATIRDYLGFRFVEGMEKNMETTVLDLGFRFWWE